MVRIGEGLDVAVIGDCNGGHSPVVGALYEVPALRDTVHVAHLRVHVQLDALPVVVILPLCQERGNRHDAEQALHRHLMLEGVLLRDALHLDEGTGSDLSHELIGKRRRHKDLADDGIRVIRKDKLHDALVVADITALVRADSAAHADLADLSHDVRNRNRVVVEIAAVDDVGILGAGKGKFVGVLVGSARSPPRAGKVLRNLSRRLLLCGSGNLPLFFGKGQTLPLGCRLCRFFLCRDRGFHFVVVEDLPCVFLFLLIIDQGELCRHVAALGKDLREHQGHAGADLPAHLAVFDVENDPVLAFILHRRVLEILADHR